MKEQKTVSDLRLVGGAHAVVLGTYSVGNDLFGEILAFDMEFAGDRSDPTC